MAVNLKAPVAEDILPVSGVVLGTAEAGIKKVGRKDLMLMELAPGSKVAGVFTKNRFAAAPVQICREHLLETNDIRPVCTMQKKPARPWLISLTRFRLRFFLSQQA